MKKWRSPECGVDPELFELIGNNKVFAISPDKKKLIEPALNKISYGLFVVSSTQGSTFNGQVCNTVFQITSESLCLAIGINKHNLTHEFVVNSGLVGISILGEENLPLVKTFGYHSGREMDKFAEVESEAGVLGVPLLPEAIAVLEGRVRKELTVDLGTHSMFIVDVVEGKVLEDVKSLTYENYQKLRKKSS